MEKEGFEKIGIDKKSASVFGVDEEYPHQKVIREKKPDSFKKENSQNKKTKIGHIEKSILKKIRKKKKEKGEEKIKVKKPSSYIKLSSSFFYDTSLKMLNQGKFHQVKRDMIKSNLNFVPAAYISAIFFSTILSFFIAILIAIFFTFAKYSDTSMFITFTTENMLDKFLKVFWVLFVLPISTFVFGYMYPSMERSTLEKKINAELPFATIHMSSISGSMIDPTKIFSIIISTKEYPYLEKEFIKIKNEINVYGYDLVTSLKHRAFNSPSKKLAELFNGLSTTITTGGSLPNFFEKRAQSLLFDHRLDVEKQSKAAETFMDIYISVVIAAPMILMLLLMMMKISGLGITLSSGAISLIIIFAVSIVNVIFIAFLHMKQA